METKTECIECYRVKSKREDTYDKIVLSKPENDDYKTLYITLPEGYKRSGKSGKLEIYHPDGTVCDLEIKGKGGKDDPIIIYPVKIGERYEEIDLPFCETKPGSEE